MEKYNGRPIITREIKFKGSMERDSAPAIGQVVQLEAHGVVTKVHYETRKGLLTEVTVVELEPLDLVVLPDPLQPQLELGVDPTQQMEPALGPGEHALAAGEELR